VGDSFGTWERKLLTVLQLIRWAHDPPFLFLGKFPSLVRIVEYPDKVDGRVGCEQEVQLAIFHELTYTLGYLFSDRMFRQLNSVGK
jgi:hypothetical protein